MTFGNLVWKVGVNVFSGAFSLTAGAVVMVLEAVPEMVDVRPLVGPFSGLISILGVPELKLLPPIAVTVLRLDVGLEGTVNVTVLGVTLPYPKLLTRTGALPGVAKSFEAFGAPAAEAPSDLIGERSPPATCCTWAGVNVTVPRLLETTTVPLGLTVTWPKTPRPRLTMDVARPVLEAIVALGGGLLAPPVEYEKGLLAPVALKL